MESVWVYSWDSESHARPRLGADLFSNHVRIGRFLWPLARSGSCTNLRPNNCVMVSKYKIILEKKSCKFLSQSLRETLCHTDTSAQNSQEKRGQDVAYSPWISGLEEMNSPLRFSNMSGARHRLTLYYLSVGFSRTPLSKNDHLKTILTRVSVVC